MRYFTICIVGMVLDSKFFGVVTTLGKNCFTDSSEIIEYYYL